ncbi:MAG: 5-(carboxyamino)imidazole ribonucleotide mutase [FCB group bacterium]|jgi:5-(carboxyamino)imidazole ribonucleotide mutase
MELPVQVGIIMGSDSDLPTMNQAAEVCKEFGVKYEMHVISAHRNPLDAMEYSSKAQKRGIKVIIAGAGGAAHLPGVLAGNTVLPVIGVPIQSKAFNGLDSLLSIVQMPPGVPVATVGIGAGKNAGLLAMQILANTSEDILNKYINYKKKIAEESKAKNNSPEFTPLK